jgi:glycosyltransferase involved in cell wall biosynthesis
MVWVIDLRFAEKNGPADADGWEYRHCRQLAQLWPQHHFVLIGSRHWPPNHFPEVNITAITAGPPANRYRLLQYWYNFRLPLLLRSHQANVFVTTGPQASYYTKVPQCLLVNMLPTHPFTKRLHTGQVAFYKSNQQRFFQKAVCLLTTTQYCATAIAEAFPNMAAKVRVVRPGASPLFAPLAYQHQEAVRNQYAKGRAYFLYAGNLLPRNNLMNLLKAFSQFKKMQKSNMMLLLAGHNNWPKNELEQSLRSYKYRHDVVLTGWLPPAEMALVMGAAYALVQPAELPGFSMSPVEAMRCGVPVIMPATDSLSEIGGPAALYAADGTVQELARQLMWVFKDEDQRNEKIAAGLEQAQMFCQQQAVHRLAEAVMGAVQQMAS